MRAMIASGIVPSAIAGRIRCLIASTNASQFRVMIASRTKKFVGCSASRSGSWRPTEGSHPSLTEKMYLRMIARKKIGIEIPISETIRLVWSIHVP